LGITPHRTKQTIYTAILYIFEEERSDALGRMMNRIGNIIPSLPRECQSCQSTPMKTIENAFTLLTSSFEWTTPTRQTVQKWHPDREPEFEELFPPIPRPAPKKSIIPAPNPPPKKEDNGYRNFKDADPHVETIPEDFLYTLEDFETGKVPGQGVEPEEDDPWSKPARWNSDDDDMFGMDDEMREGPPSLGGEYYGGSATRRKYEKKLSSKPPPPRKPQRIYRYVEELEMEYPDPEDSASERLMAFSKE
jgi:hypothetical protein